MNTVPNYELQHQLELGGMGEVWKAKHRKLRSNVVIKIVHTTTSADLDFVTRFAAIGKTLTTLRHPNLVPVREVKLSRGEQADDVTAYLVSDYINGITLDTYLNETSRDGNFSSIEQILYLFTSLTGGLDYAHQNGIFHGNIKPGNILLNQRRREYFEAGEPLLSDLGLFQLLGDAVGVASPLYMSPEQANGQTPTNLSDIYALGVILYEMCTGVQPFRDSSSIVVMMQHLNMLPTPPKLINPNIPNALSAVILRALAKDPTARFSTASLLSSALVDACSRSISQPLSLDSTPTISKPLTEHHPSAPLPASQDPLVSTPPTLSSPAETQLAKHSSRPRRARQRFTDTPIYILVVALLLLLFIIASAIGAFALLHSEQSSPPNKQDLHISSVSQSVILHDI